MHGCSEWGAHASRVLVPASRRDELCLYRGTSLTAGLHINQCIAESGAGMSQGNLAMAELAIFPEMTSSPGVVGAPPSRIVSRN